LPVLTFLALGIVALFAVPASAEKPAPKSDSSVRPIPKAWAARLAKIPWDKASMVNMTHYVTSNENRHEKFRVALEGHPTGGVFIGIGADQNYMLVGWSRPELAIMADFDKYVVAVHDVYAAFFAAAETPSAFFRLWESVNRSRAKDAIRAYFPDKAKRKKVWGMYKYSRKLVEGRLVWLRRHMKKKGVACVWTDADQYSFVRDLVRAGRVVAVLADLTGSKALAGIGDAARELKLPVRTLFTSNAEHYFDFTKNFRANILGLPIDDKSLVLRTRSLGQGKYEYYSQKLTNMAMFLKDTGTARVYDMFRRRSDTATELLYRIDGKPGDPMLKLPRGFKR